MKTKELIKILNDLDPVGDRILVVYDKQASCYSEIVHADTIPATNNYLSSMILLTPTP